MHDPSSLIAKAERLAAAGQAESARQICLKVLKQRHDDPAALHLLRSLPSEEPLPVQAVPPVRHKTPADRSVSARQGPVAPWAALGVYSEPVETESERCDDSDAVQETFQRALDLEDLGREEEAMVRYRNILASNPMVAEAHNNLGRLLVRAGSLEEAIFCYCQAVRLQPSSELNLGNLIRSLRRGGLLDGSSLDWRDALRKMPKDERTALLVAAILGEDPPAIALRRQVEELFDGYAERFDGHLVNDLHYRVPRLLRTAVDRHTPPKPLEILDLGCGTGLVGEAFRDRACRLVGIDVSRKMLEKARSKAIYDVLLEGDALTALRPSQGTYDLVVAADVFIYLGDLSPIFATVTPALRAGGRFAFSIEGHEGPGYRFHSTGRFSHSLEYIRTLAVQSGLHLDELSREMIRLQNGSPVDGFILILRKDGPHSTPITATAAASWSL